MCPRFVRFGPRSVPVVREGAETDEDGVQVNGYPNFIAPACKRFRSAYPKTGASSVLHRLKNQCG